MKIIIAIKFSEFSMIFRKLKDRGVNIYIMKLLKVFMGFNIYLIGLTITHWLILYVY